MPLIDSLIQSIELTDVTGELTDVLTGGWETGSVGKLTRTQP